MSEGTGFRGSGKPGRPPGTLNGEGKALAPIKRWKPVHEQIVLLHILGKKHVEIAATIDMTPQRVMQVLKDPRAEKQIAQSHTRLKTFFKDEVEGRMMSLGPTAVENIAETLEAEIAPGVKAKEHQDRTSLELLSRIGFGKRDTVEHQGAGVGKMDRDLQERLVSALEKSSGARAFDAAEEAEWREVVDDPSCEKDEGKEAGPILLPRPQAGGKGGEAPLLSGDAHA